MNEQKIRTCIIGLGRIASLLEEDSLREKPCTHAGAITANTDCVLAGGCDTDEERRRLFNNRWNVPVYADAAEMFRTEKPQLLVIATHPDSHYDYCRLAADSGVQVVICEKPLADTLGKAKKIAALGKSIIIITNHERRYSTDYIKAKEILSEEKLGTLLSVRAVLYMGKSKRMLDVLWHDGTHLADTAMFLTGSFLKHRKSIGSKLTQTSGTSWLLGTLKGKNIFKRHIPFIMEIGAGRDHLVFEIEFSCSMGRLRIGNGIFEVWESGASPYAEKFRSLKKTEDHFEGPTGYFVNMITDAVSCVREKNRKPASQAADGLRVIEYLNSIKAWR